MGALTSMHSLKIKLILANILRTQVNTSLWTDCSSRKRVRLREEWSGTNSCGTGYRNSHWDRESVQRHSRSCLRSIPSKFSFIYIVRLAQFLNKRVEPELPQDPLEVIIECMTKGAGNPSKAGNNVRRCSPWCPSPMPHLQPLDALILGQITNFFNWLVTRCPRKAPKERQDDISQPEVRYFIL